MRTFNRAKPIQKFENTKITVLSGVYTSNLLNDFEFYSGQILSLYEACLLYTSPSPRDRQKSRMPSSA